jgi:hypothetical protein
MPHSNRLKLSLAGTAAVALASLPLGITPASAAKVTEGTTWSYPDSVDRYQGFTVVSVRVAMNCCSYSIGLR